MCGCVSGQQEVNTLVKKLRRTFPYKKTWNLENEGKIGDDEDCSASDGENVEMSLSKAIQEIRKSRKTVVKALPEINLDRYKRKVFGRSVPGTETVTQLLQRQKYFGFMPWCKVS